MGRLSKVEQVNHANFRFETPGSYDLLDRQVQVYNTRTSYDFQWALNHLCKVGDVGFFIIRKVIKPDSAQTLVLRGEIITLVGRFVKVQT
jgi:hypothetical protein